LPNLPRTWAMPILPPSIAPSSPGRACHPNVIAAAWQWVTPHRRPAA